MMVLGGGILFFLSGQLFFAWIVAGQLVLAVLMGLLIRRDASRLVLDVSVPRSAVQGKQLEIGLTVMRMGRIFAAQRITAEFGSSNRMYGEERKEAVSLLFSRQKEDYQIRMEMEHCGQMEYDVSNIWVEDLFGLFRVKIGDTKKRHCTVYPRRFSVQMGAAARRTGVTEAEGIMQNRKGNDRSEIYDIREYAPGDDIRSIHWKLSGKMDSLMIREASDPSHYRVAILADYGIEDWSKVDREAKEQEWDAIIAAGAAIGRELVAKGEKFCMIFPGEAGLKICEIENRQEYTRMLGQWMGMSMKKEQGTGFRYFSNQHLEEKFGRLIILSAGNYEENLAGAAKRIAVTVLSAKEELKTQRNSRISDLCEVLEIPAKNTEGVCRILC